MASPLGEVPHRPVSRVALRLLTPAQVCWLVRSGFMDVGFPGGFGDLAAFFFQALLLR